MKTRKTIRILTLIAVVIASWGLKESLDPDGSSLARPQATITIHQPDGSDDTIGEGDDFATTVLGDPWDMNQATDILALHGLPDGTVSGGLLRFTMDEPAIRVPLLLPGVSGAADVGKVGANYPIDTDRYRWLSFRLNQPSGNVQIKWRYDKTGSKWVSSQLMPVTPGWHTYVIDLESVPIGNTKGGATGWEGHVWGLDVIPFSSVGAEIVIDWARLTADNPAGNSLSVAWSDLDPAGSNVDFFLDSDQTGCDGTLIHTAPSASASGSFTWQDGGSDTAAPTQVEPGSYYVCAKVNDQLAGYSAGKLTLNRAPIVHFTQPSYSSGDDYATDAGNPWDMNEAADFDTVNNASLTIQGGIAAVTVPASQTDVQLYLNVPSAIARNNYYYLTYRLWFDYPYTWDDVGQVTRVFWGRAPTTEATSGLIYVFPGWQTYSVDLRTLELHSGPTWSTADWTLFRIDPIGNYSGERVTFYLDDVKLTGDEQADLYADVKWELTDPDSTHTTMDLYYDTDAGGLDGTLIATLPLTDGARSLLTAAPSLQAKTPLTETLPLTPTLYLPLVTRNWHPSCTGACYTWSTGKVAPGSYYLYACLDDGYNALCRYSERPLIITHAQE